ncbi:hypothetical protein [Thermoflavimicrobium dichotomicum]|uniref:Uncharacterized protein n=1 Tax=Thermoflavimicrobium dichotomicum TaxID=46223 RepID=A0A1I3SGH6_9BACL|nr:hypothetical protein [Thermoflavimicrobium dichotomicum]SFJ57874.1 hypothetical protein SAMN05421852_11330 [Thermoflavimicrobium dichotomicum]
MKALAQRLLATVVLSILIAALLSFIPILQQRNEAKSEVAVFQSSIHSKLTEKNLVDYMLSLALKVEMKRVDLQGDQLIVDLSQPKHLQDAMLYKECFLLLKSSFVGLSNIKRVDLLISLANGKRVKIEANQQHLEKDPQMEKLGKRSYQAYLQEMFHWIWIPDNSEGRSGDGTDNLS